MEKMKKVDVEAYKWFDDKDPSQWSRAYFNSYPRCDILLNNMCEVFNSFILDARDKPILTLMLMVKDLVMVRMQINRDKCTKWEGRLPREKLLKCVKDASTCLPVKCDRSHFQVYSGSTANQCAVDLEKRKCSCRKWQLNGIPCKHACASIRLNGDNVEEFVDEAYTVETYRRVYGHAIKPMAGLELWPQTGRVAPIPPPITQKKAGRTRRLRRVNPIETEDNGSTEVCKVRKYLCKTCKGQGHNSRACKKNKSGPVPVPVEEEPTPTVQPESMNDYQYNTSQSSINRGASPSQTRSQTTSIPHVPTSACGVSIRAPTPMVGTYSNMPAFKPPTRKPPVFINQGRKFVAMKDFTQKDA